MADHHELEVTSLESTRSFVGAVHDTHGRVDVLVNNAGVMPLSAMDALNVDEWDRMIDVNIRGVLHGIAAVLPVMRERGAGHVVNLASVSGLRVDPTAAVYSATKFAVRVTVVSPGLTRSELTDGISDPGGGDRRGDPAAVGGRRQRTRDQADGAGLTGCSVRPYPARTGGRAGPGWGTWCAPGSWRGLHEWRSPTALSSHI